MSKKDNRSIAFIYDEMDPSEKLEFERDLEIDNNLLIEVESLKNVSENLNNLKEIAPPQDIVEIICKSAVKHKSRTGGSYKRSAFYAAAAILLLGMTSGFFLLDGYQKNTESNSSAGAASVGSSSPVLTEFVHPRTTSQNNNITTSSITSGSAATISTASTNRVSPWVDHNEVIHFHDRFGAGESAAIDSIFRNSMQKLTPVTDPAQSKHFQRNLHLTGSRR
jgi:hypothetical protein